MIDAALEAEIRRLFFAEHWKQGTIATQLGVHPDVVKRVVGTLGVAAGSRRPPPDVLDPYKAFIDETLERYPKLVGTRVYDMIRARGYVGSLRTLRRYLRQARPKPKSEVFLRTEALPGEQGQIDWAHVGKLEVPGGLRSLWLFMIVLAYSRAVWAELVFEQTIHSLRRSLVRAAVFFGGVPRQWLFDNPKTVVVERQGDAVRFHPELLGIAGALRVQPRLCAVGRPQHKGIVERTIRWFKERFFGGRVISSIPQGNTQLLDFIETVAHPRPHPTLPELTVADAFALERPRLLDLPDSLPATDEVRPVVVDKTARFHFDTNIYSVPHDYAEDTFTLAADDAIVRVLTGTGDEIARHDRCWGHKQVVEAPEHRTALVEHKRGARERKGRDLLRTEVPRIDELYLRWADRGRNLGSMTARTLKLLELYGGNVLREAVDEMLERGTHDLGALGMLCEQRRTRPGPTVPLLLGDHVPERDVIPHDLGGYDE